MLLYLYTPTPLNTMTVPFLHITRMLWIKYSACNSCEPSWFCMLPAKRPQQNDRQEEVQPARLSLWIVSPSLNFCWTYVKLILYEGHGPILVVTRTWFFGRVDVRWRKSRCREKFIFQRRVLYSLLQKMLSKLLQLRVWQSTCILLFEILVMPKIKSRQKVFVSLGKTPYGWSKISYRWIYRWSIVMFIPYIWHGLLTHFY